MRGDGPIYEQIVDMIEDRILAGDYRPDDLIMSVPQMSKLLSVNPTTAQRAVTVMTDRGLIHRKRGIGMAVTTEARDIILTARRQAFYEHALPDFIAEARRIGLSDHDLLDLVQERLS